MRMLHLEQNFGLPNVSNIVVKLGHSGYPTSGDDPGPGPDPQYTPNLTASVPLYCPTFTSAVWDEFDIETPAFITPSEGDQMYRIVFTPNRTSPDPMTGLMNWTGVEEFTWTPGWSEVNDPTNVLILTGDESYWPTVLAEVVPDGFEEIEVLGGEEVMVGCGLPGTDGTSSWSGWNFAVMPTGLIDPTKRALFIRPVETLADFVRVVDPSDGTSVTLAEWIANHSDGGGGGGTNWVSYDLTVPEGDVFDGESGLKVMWNFPMPGLLTVRIPGVDELSYRTHLSVFDRIHDVALTDWAPFSEYEIGSYTGTAWAGDELTFTISWDGD